MIAALSLIDSALHSPYAAVWYYSLIGVVFMVAVICEALPGGSALSSLRATEYSF